MIGISWSWISYRLLVTSNIRKERNEKKKLEPKWNVLAFSTIRMS